MGIAEPLCGALFDWGSEAPGSTIGITRRLMLETELGYRLATDVTGPINAADVPGVLATCHPMIEIASPNLAGKLTGEALIATNAASYKFIEGPGVDPGALDLDEVSVSLSYEGEALYSEPSGSFMGGQANAIAWLINFALETGYPVERGMLLMTGAIGAPQPGKPGRYRATYSGMDAIEFTLA